MPHATPAQLNTRMGRTVAADAATQALDEASAVVDAFVGYPLAQQTGYVWETTVGGLGHVYLPRRFTAVSAVTLNGTALATSAYVVDIPNHTLKLAVGTFQRGDVVRVTGTSGYATVPLVVRSVTLSVAARAVENPAGGIRSESLSDHAITYAGDDPTGGAYLTDTEEIMLENAGLRDWLFG